MGWTMWRRPSNIFSLYVTELGRERSGFEVGLHQDYGCSVIPIPICVLSASLVAIPPYRSWVVSMCALVKLVVRVTLMYCDFFTYDQYVVVNIKTFNCKSRICKYKTTKITFSVIWLWKVFTATFKTYVICASNAGFPMRACIVQTKHARYSNDSLLHRFMVIRFRALTK